MIRIWRDFWCKSNKEELHLSILSWTAKDPDIQKIRIIEIIAENKFHKQLESGCYNLQQVPPSNPSDHASFKVLEATPLYSN